jgi:replicative DNA helicase
VLAPGEPQRLVTVPAGRVPPHSLDAERSVLGGVLLDNQAMEELLAVLKPADFYREAHAKIFAAMAALHEKREPIDRVTVKNALKEMGALEAIGGEQFIDLLDTVVPSASNLVYYGTIVYEKAVARKVIEAAHSISSMAYENPPLNDLTEYSETRILVACEITNAGEGPTLPKAAVVEVFKQLERDFESASHITGLASGFPALDELTAGFQDGNLIILAARPSVGKTALLEQWLLNAVLRNNFSGLVFELEMTKAELIKRGAAQEGEIEADRLRKPKLLRDQEWTKLAKFADQVTDAPLYIDDQPGLSYAEIRARARRVFSKCRGTGKPLKLIGVDHAQLLGGEGRNEEERISRNSRELKKLSKELGLPIVLLSQLNRESEKRKGEDSRPKNSDLRGSGALEQDGDVIIFLHREKDDHELIITKNRNGPLGTVHLNWNRKYTRFESTPEDQHAQRTLYYDGPPVREAPPHTDDDAPGA